MQIPSLYIRQSELEGRGVFCGEDISADSVIEVCPVIVIPAKEMEALKSTNLYNYYFEWGEDRTNGAIALGFGSLYNHSYEPNAVYEVDDEFEHLSVYAIKDIPAGTEITFNYNGLPEDQEKVWFDK